MTSVTSIIDLETLLKPFPGENPAGTDIRYSELYDAFCEARRSDDPFADILEGDPRIPEWEDVLQSGSHLLASHSKDLQIAVWLVEALVNLQGFTGLLEGLKLVRGLQEQFWEKLFPEMEDGDLEGRANALAWMDREITVLISQIPFTNGMSGHIYTFEQWKESEKFKIPESFESLGYEDQQRYKELKALAEEEGKITSEQWKIGKNTTSREFYLDLSQILRQCWDELVALDRFMDEAFGRQTPGVGQLKKILDEMKDLVSRVLREKGGEEPLVKSTSAPAQAQSAPTGMADGEFHGEQGSLTSGFSGPIRNRQDAITLLTAVSTYYKKAEPHSPVPYLIERAIRWSGMTLEEWLREALKDETALGNVKETLGIFQYS